MNTTSAAPTQPRNPPRAQGLPLVGVLPEFTKNPLEFFIQAAVNYGRVVQLDLGPRRMILISHPEDIKYVLQDNNKNYTKGYDMVKPLMGEGLVSSDGELWLRQRRIIQPLFNRPNLVSLLPMMEQAARETIETWKARRDPDQPLDMAAEMMLLTQTIILRTMFSADLGNQSKRISADFGATLEYMNSILMSPHPLLQQLPTATNRRFKSALARLEGIVYQFIAERRARGEHDRSDLLAVLMQARDPETGEGMSDQQMRDEIMTIFLAGHETTATLLSWTFFLLGQNPEQEARLRAEIEAVLGGRAATADDINRLPYTRQVLDEALRLYPPAWMFARQPIADDEVGGCRIPAGQMVTLSPWVTHRLPEYWPDPQRFDPDRFLPEAAASRPRFAYFPFGGGPRQCIGMPFTYLEAPLLLTMILQNFSQLKLLPGQEIRPIPMATLRPHPAVWVSIK